MTEPSFIIEAMEENDKEDPFNHSFPGCNPQFDIVDNDGIKKRL